MSGDIILHMCTINENYMMYDSSDVEHEGQKFFHFGPFFALLPSNCLENQNFEKITKTPGDVIILQMCAKNHDHMMYTS